ncbi:hypothetical protein HED60_19165 [Planctomycetales bacterium ZRK34]|nr:hypothetical protein HED60_19165 [Planctomycetales bacterium ZRK34]
MAFNHVRALFAVLSLVLAMTVQAQAAVVAHWSFDADSGTSVADSARPGSPGTIIDSAGTLNAPGVFNASGPLSTGGVELSGNSQGVRVPRIDLATSSFTFAAWIDPTSLTPQAQIFGDWSSPWQMRFYINSLDAPNPGKLGFDLRADGPNPNNGNIIGLTTGSTYVTTGSGFQHVAVTWDRDTKTATIYYNGAVVGSATSAMTNVDAIDGNHANYDIGYKQDGGGEFIGNMDEVWVFTTALGVNDIQSLITANAIPEPSSLCLLAIAGLMLRRR